MKLCVPSYSLYLAIILKLTGMIHGDKKHRVPVKRDGREVVTLQGGWADLVLHIGTTLHREKLGPGQGTPE